MQINRICLEWALLSLHCFDLVARCPGGGVRREATTRPQLWRAGFGAGLCGPHDSQFDLSQAGPPHDYIQHGPSTPFSSPRSLTSPLPQGMNLRGWLQVPRTLPVLPHLSAIAPPRGLFPRLHVTPSQTAGLGMNSSEFPPHCPCPSMVRIRCGRDLARAVGQDNYRCGRGQWHRGYSCRDSHVTALGRATPPCASVSLSVKWGQFTYLKGHL